MSNIKTQSYEKGQYESNVLLSESHFANFDVIPSYPTPFGYALNASTGHINKWDYSFNGITNKDSPYSLNIEDPFLSLEAGPFFAFELLDNFYLNVSPMLSFLLLNTNTKTKYRFIGSYNISFGFTTDLAFRYVINKIFTITLGMKASYYPISSVSVIDTYRYTTEPIEIKAFSYGFRPYIGIGLKLRWIYIK